MEKVKRVLPFKMDKEAVYATGKRKTSIARLWLKKGKGTFLVNKLDINLYFNRNAKSQEKSIYTSKANEPLSVVGEEEKFDVICTVSGGGKTGQVEAIRHAVAKALRIVNEEYKLTLRKHSLLTRDARKVERKKYGRRKARKLCQFSKR